MKVHPYTLTFLHSEWPKLYEVLAVLSAIGLKVIMFMSDFYDLYNSLGLYNQIKATYMSERKYCKTKTIYHVEK